MKFNLNKLRSWGLRYIVRDESGQIHAYDTPPVRDYFPSGTGYWRVADCLLPPNKPEELHYYIDTEIHKAVVSDEELEKEYHDRCKEWYLYLLLSCREVHWPLSDCPFKITWEDEPLDLVASGLVPEEDMKKWGDPPKVLRRPYERSKTNP